MTRRKKKTQAIWPITAPGMPPVGHDLIAEAHNLGDELSTSEGTGRKMKETHGPMVEEVLRRALYGRGEVAMNFTIKDNKRDEFIVVPGHVWGRKVRGRSMGPERAEAMVIGKCLGEDEANRGSTSIRVRCRHSGWPTRSTCCTRRSD